MSTPRRAATRLARPGREPVEVDAVLHRADGDADGRGEPSPGLAALLVHGAGGNLDAPLLIALADVLATSGTPTPCRG